MYLYSVFLTHTGIYRMYLYSVFLTHTGIYRMYLYCVFLTHTGIPHTVVSQPAHSIQSYFWSILILLSHLRLGLPSGPFSPIFRLNSVCTIHQFHACYISHPFLSSFSIRKLNQIKLQGTLIRKRSKRVPKLPIKNTKLNWKWYSKTCLLKFRQCSKWTQWILIAVCAMILWGAEKNIEKDRSRNKHMQAMKKWNNVNNRKKSR